MVPTSPLFLMWIKDKKNFGSHERSLIDVSSPRIQKGVKTKITTQQYIQLNTRAKEIQQLAPVSPTTDTTLGPNRLIYR